MVEWGSKLSFGMNYFTDPMVNVFYMELEEGLISNKLFCISFDFEEFYDLDDVHYICTLFWGDWYFRLRIFNMGWDEIRYPRLASVVVVEENLVWSWFLSSLRVKLCPTKVSFCNWYLLTFSYCVYLFDMNIITYQTGCIFLHIMGEEDSKW